MRGTVAKRIRKAVYGKGTHPGPIRYHAKKIGHKDGETVFADALRHIYQEAKKGYRP